MLVWRKGNIEKTVCVTVLCTILTVHEGTNTRTVLTGRSTVSGFDLAWFSSLFSERFCVFDVHGAIYVYIFKNVA